MTPDKPFMQPADIIKQAQNVLKIEAEGVMNLIDRLGEGFVSAVQMIYESRGRVIVTGIGKSGLVGRKISATLNSTGQPSLFLHPVEAVHGDLGMVQKNDVVLALSNSGETAELVAIMEIVQDMGAKVVALTGVADSTLASYADAVLDAHVDREACPMGLAPTASTTAALALGDALAVALINVRRFSSKDFKRLHPGGELGQRLSVEVREVMLAGNSVPIAAPGDSVKQAMEIMHEYNLGVLLIVSDGNLLEGIFTDGDLRRLIMENGRMADGPISEIMTRKPYTIAPNRLASQALEIMQEYEITVLPIVEKGDRLLGVVNLHKLLGKGKFSFNGSPRRVS